MIIPVILSGGSGTRLWPLSRKDYPKQFLRLSADNNLSTLQNTLERVQGEDYSNPIIIANDNQRFRVAQQILECKSDAKIILEPDGRNTFPACIIACKEALNLTKDAVVLILASDHIIQDLDSFKKAISQGHDTIKNNKSPYVTFGIKPDFPSTGFGYIEQGREIDKGVYSIKNFREKPNKATAEEFIESGNFLWNSGMFMFDAKEFLKDAEKHDLECTKLACKSLEKAKVDLSFTRLVNEYFDKCTDISVDCAIMEKVSNASVIPVDIGWSDVGNFKALWELSEKDELGNATYGDILIDNTKSSYIKSNDGLVATIGVEDLIVINSKDATLVAHKDKSEDVKNIVNILKANKRKEYAEHLKTYRPWGLYENIVEAEGFKAKRIIVNEGCKLSLQMHHHRAEHWIIVKGTAKVTIDDKEFLLSEDQSTYIPVGAKHRLENPGKFPLELIEVQTGAYLEEDDIVRFEDTFGRLNHYRRR